MESTRGDDRIDEAICDWCRVKESRGVFFVPGKGIFNLCEDCRSFLMAVLIDGG